MMAAEAVPALAAEIVECRFGTPTRYDIRVTLPGGVRTVLRRYRDFEELHAALSARMVPLPAMPPKAGPSMLKPSFRTARQDGLEAILREALRQFPTLESDELSDFLEAEIDDRIALQGGGLPPVPAAAVEPNDHNAAPARAPVESAALPIPTEPLSEMERIRQERHQSFLARQAAAAAAAPPSAAPASSSAGGASSSSAPAPAAGGSGPAAPAEELTRLAILPTQELPEENDDEKDRLALLRDVLKDLKQRGVVLEVGTVLQSPFGFTFAVVKCVPDRGVVGEGTSFFLQGPALPRLTKVQFLALTKKEPGVTEQTLFQQHITPHFKESFADASRVAIVTLNETPAFRGVRFSVAAMDPDKDGLGIVDRTTEIFTQMDDADEFTRIHVVPFMDTLPQAYEYDVFHDYVMPFFDSHRVERFAKGESFVHSGVHFKVVATEPDRGSPKMRVGRGTQIFSEGRLHPTVADLLSPEHTRMLAVFPPGIQMLLLQTDAFGNGEIADRIIAAQSMRSASRGAGVTESTLARTTETNTWSEELRERMSLEQTQCIVCLGDFEDGDEVRHLPCKHVFHTSCIDEWLGRDANCPLCRTGLERQNSRRGRGGR